MIVTLVANTRKWQQGLRRAGSDTMTFGKVAQRGLQMGALGVVSMVASLARVIPKLADMGAESRKADIQLKFMLENMNGISQATDNTVKRMAKYADEVSKATGIDDESIKAIQKKLLVFKTLRKSADQVGGAFDRTTKAAMDLAAGGFGDAEQNASKLGRMLENPVRNLNALNRAGITFTESEKRKIAAMMESGKVLEAQDLILQSVEGRVKGLAEASATPFEKLTAQFNDIGDSIGEAMLPALEDMNGEISLWLGTKQGKKDVQDIADAFVEAAKGVKAMVGFLKDVKGLLDAITKFNMDWVGALRDFYESVTGRSNGGNNPSSPGGNPSAPGGPKRMAEKTGITVNINTPIDSVSAGREIKRVLDDYARANGSR